MAEDVYDFRFGYNTNGYAHHRLEDALQILQEQGWNAVALTLDVHHLDPLRASAAEVDAVRRRLADHAMEVAIETGARFVLDPRRKHRPTLLEASRVERNQRLDYLRRCGDIAAALAAPKLSFWAGALTAESTVEQGWERLIEGVSALLNHLDGSGVAACLEPEPGMLIETLADFLRLKQACPPLLLALDVGHLYVTGEEAPAAAISSHAAHLGQLTLEDMRRGRHDHLPFGEGDVDVPTTLRALWERGWQDPIYVELGRHSHDAVATSRRALDYLKGVAKQLGLPAPLRDRSA